MLFGGFVAVYSATALKIGDISQPGPGLFPLFCGIGIVFLCGLWLVLNRACVVDKGPLWPDGRWKTPALGIFVISLYAFLMTYVGYPLATIVFLVTWQKLIENENWKRTTVIALVGTAVMYVLFVYLLKVAVPAGMFE